VYHLDRFVYESVAHQGDTQCLAKSYVHLESREVVVADSRPSPSTGYRARGHQYSARMSNCAWLIAFASLCCLIRYASEHATWQLIGTRCHKRGVGWRTRHCTSSNGHWGGRRNAKRYSSSASPKVFEFCQAMGLPVSARWLSAILRTGMCRIT